MTGSFYHLYISPRAGVTREQIETVLNAATDWFRYDSKNWILYTTRTPKKWYAALEKFVNPEGSLFIVRLDTNDYWGLMVTSCWEWIRKPR